MKLNSFILNVYINRLLNYYDNVNTDLFNFVDCKINIFYFL